MYKCLNCKKQLKSSRAKYCSISCQKHHEYSQYIYRWQIGLESGLRGKTTINISQHVRRYINTVYSDMCSRCGWNKINIHTGQRPLEIDHIDGDASNNDPTNLTLLCPNCHSLTSTYKNANNGNGRGWRRDKYVKIVKLPL